MRDLRRSFRQKPDGELDPAGEAGWFLQRERERRGDTLAVAGQACGIHPHHLEAIETGDLTRLPARNEALRMIGTYGAYLGFDPQPLVLHYAQFLPKPGRLAAPPRPAPPRPAPKPLGSAKIIPFPVARALQSMASGSGGVIASVLVAVMLFGAATWLMAPPTGPAASDHAEINVEPPEAPESRKSGVAFGPETPVASVTSTVDTPLSDAKGGGETAMADRAADGLQGLGDFISSQIGEVETSQIAALLTDVPEPALNDAAPVAEAPSGRAYGSDNGDARLVLRATAPVWVRIEDRKGNVVMTQTLLTGDSYRVPNRSDLVIIARDGGLLTVEIDGQAKGRLGQPGEILVGRSLDIERLDLQG